MNDIYLLVVLFSVLLPAWAEVPVVDANPVQGSFLEPAHSEQAFVRSEDQLQGSRGAVLLNKLQALQTELQELRGKLEVESHDLKLLRDQQRAFYKDLDGRLNQLQPAKEDLNKQATVEPVKPSVVAVAGDDVQTYSLAFELVKAKKFGQAVAAMRAFVETFPKSHYAPNAHYWLGELYLLQGKLAQSVAEFQTVISQYPTSSKVAGARLKLGFAYYDLGKTQEAREELSKIKRDFPNTALARLAEARLNDMNNPAFN